MLLATGLIAARKEYDEGKINNDGFADKVNMLLAIISQQATPEEKIAAFDKIADFIGEHYQVEELDGGIQYIKSDLGDYLFEETVGAILGGGPAIWTEFYNKTYEST